MVLETTSSFSSVFKFWGFLGWDRIAKSEGGFIRNSQTYISVGLPVRVTSCGNRFVSSITDCRKFGDVDRARVECFARAFDSGQRYLVCAFGRF